MSDQNS